MDALESAKVDPPEPKLIAESVTCEVVDGFLVIGNTKHPVFDPINRTMVPDILFYDNTEVNDGVFW